MNEFEFGQEVAAGRVVANARGINRRRTAIALGIGTTAIAIGAAAAFLL